MLCTWLTFNTWLDASSCKSETNNLTHVRCSEEPPQMTHDGHEIYTCPLEWSQSKWGKMQSSKTLRCFLECAVYCQSVDFRDVLCSDVVNCQKHVRMHGERACDVCMHARACMHMCVWERRKRDWFRMCVGVSGNPTKKKRLDPLLCLFEENWPLMAGPSLWMCVRVCVCVRVSWKCMFERWSRVCEACQTMMSSGLWPLRATDWEPNYALSFYL